MAYYESQGIAVTGLDLSAGILNFARQEVSGGLVLMNMCQLGFRAVCYEGAWSCASLLHVPKQAAAAALREMWRILKPGGMLILSIQEGNTFFQTANLNACWRFFLCTIGVKSKTSCISTPSPTPT